MSVYFRCLKGMRWRWGWAIAGLVAAAAGWAQTSAPAGTRSQPAAPARKGPDRSPEYPHPTRVPASVLRPHRPQAVILPSDPSEQDLPPERRGGGTVAQVAPSPPLSTPSPQEFKAAPSSRAVPSVKEPVSIQRLIHFSALDL